MGNPQQDRCPWCNGPGVLIEGYIPSDLIPQNYYCIQCMRCHARGPTLQIPKEHAQIKEVYNEIVELIWQRFKTRRPWDEGFVNEYEK